jgi:hypothetical protein
MANMYWPSFLLFTGLSFLVGIAADYVPRRASVGFLILLFIPASTADLVTSLAWSNLMGLSFAEYESNQVAVALGPSILFLLTVGGCGLNWYMHHAARPLPAAVQRLERVFWTSMSARSALLCVWNAYVGLWKLGIMSP